MNDEVLPRIAEQDYPRFREIARDLPDTYEEWRAIYNKEKLHLKKMGHNVRQLPVDPQCFIQYCHSRKQEPSWQTLWHFAMEMAAQQRQVTDYEPFAES
jgi:hypothetical protein